MATCGQRGVAVEHVRLVCQGEPRGESEAAIVRPWWKADPSSDAHMEDRQYCYNTVGMACRLVLQEYNVPQSRREARRVFVATNDKNYRLEKYGVHRPRAGTEWMDGARGRRAVSA